MRVVKLSIVAAMQVLVGFASASVALAAGRVALEVGRRWQSRSCASWRSELAGPGDAAAQTERRRDRPGAVAGEDRTDALRSHSRRGHPPEAWLDERHSGQPQSVETPPRVSASLSLLFSTSRRCRIRLPGRPPGFRSEQRRRIYPLPRTAFVS